MTRIEVCRPTLTAVISRFLSCVVLLRTLLMGGSRTIYALLHPPLGLCFHVLGQQFAFHFLLKGKIKRFRKYYLNPVVLFRFAEFDFALQNGDWDNKKLLDISSPRMFTAYLSSKTRFRQIFMVNPDETDLKESIHFFSEVGIATSRIRFLDSLEDVRGLFDIIYSISVIEHVIDSEENNFLYQIWSRLNEGGEFILTFPAANKFCVEYSDYNHYGLNVPRNDKGKFFFQRVYDEETTQSRIIRRWNRLGGNCINKALYGLREGLIFSEYLERRRQFGFKETQKDILYATWWLRHYDRFDELPDRGICALKLVKSQRTNHFQAATDQ